MKVKIRQSVFETNSSSMHSIVIATIDELEQFKSGKLNLRMIFPEGEFVEDETHVAKDRWDDSIVSYEEFIHLNDNDEGYDMINDQEEYPVPGSIIKTDNNNYILHYQA